MSSDEFRRYGKELIDWVADYYEKVESLPVTPTVQPGAIRALLPPNAPEGPEPFAEIIEDLDRVVMPGITHWQSPNWFAYFPGDSSFPAILGELVSAGLAQQGMLWSTSPATTEIESHMMDWLVDLLGLPAAWKTTGPGGGVIQMSASDSTHTALVVARQLAQQSTSLDNIVAYASSQAHSSIEKGARVAGYRHFRTIGVDENFAMRPELLVEAITSDRQAGLLPAFVCSAVGTTGTTAVDPVRAVGEIARREGMWHHVDAAYAGSAMICPEFRIHQDGLELADSYVFNPHKWMFVNFDASAFYVADRRPLIETLSILPPYLQDAASQSGAVIDYRDWHVPLGRRFRALKLWFTLRTYGAEGIRTKIREHVTAAGTLTAQLEGDARFEVVAPTLFALVSFRHVDGDPPTDRLAARINDSGRAYLTASKLPDGSSFIRVSIGQTNTTQHHVDELWTLIDEMADPAIGPLPS
ncbi:MAG: aspartate aminotransferase family protein [Acidimicrobiia bacterium]|nr:aspartate aminotransferase family protein [Acidimicrobiia bacterium]